MRRRSGRTIGFAAVRAVRDFPWIPAAAGAGLGLLGWGCRAVGWDEPGLYLLAAAGMINVGCVVWWWLRHVATPGTTRRQLARASARAQRAGGVASRLDIAEHASAKTLRVQAKVLRPSTAELSWWRRRRLPVAELGVEICRLGLGWWGQRVHVSCEDATGFVALPRAGKTQALARYGESAPGALVTTSTRLDLAQAVQPARKDRAVHVFNPAGLGGVPSTVRWSVLVGCQEFGTASRRAGDLIPESSGEAERWDTQARRILALLLHAAAVSGKDMQTVVRWVGDDSERARDQVIDALGQVPDGGEMRVAEARQFWSINDRTRTSITATIMPALGWLSDDRARPIGDAPAGTTTLDIPRMIAESETLHLLGHEDKTGLAPLIGAVVAEIGHQARMQAAYQPSGRLDPSLSMLLDEVGIVCPIPLHKWTADMGGRNVTLHISVQSLSQLRDRWGHDAAATILNNLSALVIFGGGKDADDLQAVSTLTGEHRRRVLKLKDDQEHTSYRWQAVLSPAEIAALEPGQVLVLRRGLHPVVGHAPQIRYRRGWKPAPLPADPAPVTFDEVVDGVDLSGLDR